MPVFQRRLSGSGASLLTGRTFAQNPKRAIGGGRDVTVDPQDSSAAKKWRFCAHQV